MPTTSAPPPRNSTSHDSLQSTLTILGHKLRIKQIGVEKRFGASPSTIHTRGSAISQVWTNLIDNAVDASPPNSQIEIATWSEPGWLSVSIVDHGEGIPPEVQPRIFEPFFTTKPLGSGTGLGLEIVHRIVTQKFGGKSRSSPGPGTLASSSACHKTVQWKQIKPHRWPSNFFFLLHFFPGPLRNRPRRFGARGFLSPCLPVVRQNEISSSSFVPPCGEVDSRRADVRG